MIQRLDSRTVYADAWMSVRQDDVRYADGSVGTYGVVEKPDFALILPRERDGFWLVRQFRYPIARQAWEFPQGGWAAGSAGSQEDLARAELAEETGLRAAVVTHLGRLDLAPGFSTQGFDVFLAEGLTQGVPRREAGESDMVHAWFSGADLAAMICSGALVDGPTLAALGLLRAICHAGSIP